MYMYMYILIYYKIFELYQKKPCDVFFITFIGLMSLIHEVYAFSKVLFFPSIFLIDISFLL